ncbi:calcium-binding protein [Oharaeibacter diazotrophicus]|uniref:Hemolysin type calcium-binding protein n=1 Tax=Oharaeibacter diazotrophicus TaxID=1920512 RepID=A0A4R6RC71_9HYPH|nr:calcium-binding protein [Oharaeibacter diazotrophicus]TDP83277.1 hypothetical protein EDD54_3236 [Oharaeibacter diazotrophicus]BBE72110.1 poly(beta-D-mannuronate) C5 epimerase 7 [Pleomorphomonas sp. SM30]GLS78875.1 hypothetical protein GCM10007904_42120 [Oharaeibacter diazotrophicus]
MPIDIGPQVDWFGPVTGGAGEVVAEQMPNGDAAIVFSQGATIVAAVRSAKTGKVGKPVSVTFEAEPTAPGGVTTVREIFVGPLKSGFVAILSMADSKLGGDPNLSLVGQVFSATGAKVGKPFHVNPANAAKIQHDAVAVVGLADGGFNVYFNERDSYFSIYTNGLTMRRFDATGVAKGPAKVIVPNETLGFVQTDPINPAAILKPDGKILLAYMPNQANGAALIRTRTFTPDGVPVGPAADVDGVGVVDTAPSMARLKDGRIAMAYLQVPAGTTSAVAVARFLNKDGKPVAKLPFRVSSDLPGRQGMARVEATANGGFAVSWARDYTTFLARLFGPLGKPLGRDFPVIAPVANAIYGYGGVVAAGTGVIGYQSAIVVPSAHVYAKAYGLGSTVGITRAGTPGPDAYTGGAKDDDLSGAASADKLVGAAGIDSLAGGDGPDVLSGGDGPDVLDGGPDKDTVTGGRGPDSFVIAGTDQGPDKFTDFDAAGGDRIALRGDGFKNSIGIPLVGVFLVTGEAPKPWLPVPTFLFDTRTKRLSYDPNGTFKDDDPLPLADLPGVTTLTAGNFTIY